MKEHVIMDRNTLIASLVAYGLEKGLIEACDRIYVTNQLLERLKLDSWEPADLQPHFSLAKPCRIW